MSNYRYTPEFKDETVRQMKHFIKLDLWVHFAGRERFQINDNDFTE
jgi:hypothetical protein